MDTPPFLCLTLSVLSVSFCSLVFRPSNGCSPAVKLREKLIQSKLLVLNMAGKDVFSGDPGVLKVIDTYDRRGKAFTSGTYSHAGTYADAFENEPGKRLPKAGAVAGAGVGLARAEWSVFQAEAKGPNASAGAGASLASGAKAFANAELASASASAGPVKAKIGLGLGTGVGISLTHVEAKVLGTGISFGRKMGVSLFGSSLEFSLW
ncbi:hypothetical protein L3Q82_016223 [Scortum barcoo]|uniref:Uncharacterized protein n=1 Tax=Scortum barcoo TaxID=214431 RepID=A0ACB8VQG8_9TELE|nr:hypothetical protein L3Q82_016223 [Scortum barcoo]